MAKLNSRITLISLGSLALLLQTGTAIAMSANETKFDWQATESAPKNYPMKIISGNLRYHDAPGGGGLYVPSGGRINNGWGRGNSVHVTGPDLKPLPDKLDITYFSYLEDAFYEGSFDLPYDKILSFFREGAARPKKKDRDGNDIPNYFRIIVGVAPGGTVAVWASDEGNKEVFFGQAQKTDMDSAKAFRIPIANRKERTDYVNETLKDALAPEVLAAIHKNGTSFKQWAQYRTPYHWVPTFAVGHPLKGFGVSFYNGEGGRYNFPLEQSFTSTAHPVPDEIDFTYAINGEGKRYQYIIHFDEPEMLTAFAKLGANQKPLQLEFDPKFPKRQTQIRLHNDKESIPLKNFTVEEW